MPGYLADKSALVHLAKRVVATKMNPLIMNGDVATCGIVELEVLYSARSAKDFAEVRTERTLAFPRIPIEEADFVRAEEVMGELAKTGRHRAVSLPDLLVAAVAERAGVVVLHYDKDFDIVASVTGQPVEWVAPKGSL
jgi:predicted nucleic acid-binding protein